MMKNSAEFQPNWVSIPGETIVDLMKSKNIDFKELSKLLEIDEQRARDLTFGELEIDSKIAELLSLNLGASAQFWINREGQYRESIKRLQNEAEKVWIKSLPINDMVRLEYIDGTKDLVDECKSFFKVDNVWSWNKKYTDVVKSTSFKKSETLMAQQASVAAWLRQGEIISERMNCGSWSQDLLTENLQELRKLIGIKDPKRFVPRLQEICAKCGVAVVIQRTPEKCPVSGAARFLSSQKAMIILSFRYLSDDQFWFSFFHEIAHLILHSGEKTFIEGLTSATEDSRIIAREKEANAFALNVLIPEPFQQRLQTMKSRQTDIKQLSKEADISLGIIVGQLQYMNRLRKDFLNGFKRRYNIDDIISVSL